MFEVLSSVLFHLSTFVVTFYSLCILCDEHLVPAVEVFIKQFEVPEEVAGKLEFSSSYTAILILTRPSCDTSCIRICSSRAFLKLCQRIYSHIRSFFISDLRIGDDCLWFHPSSLSYLHTSQ